MTKNEFIELLNRRHLALLALTGSKGEEYSNSADQLANFKRQAADLGLTPEQVNVVFLNKHLDAIKSYVRTGRTLSEDIMGRIDDAILYLMLLSAIIEERAWDEANVEGRV